MQRAEKTLKPAADAAPTAATARPQGLQALIDRSPRMQAQLRSMAASFGRAMQPPAQLERHDVAQRVAPYHAWMHDNAAFLDELETDHYALSSYSNLSAITVINVHHDPRVIKQLDLANANAVHPELKARLIDLTSSVHIRPATPTHDNQEGNLPGGQVYYEMGMEGGGGTRLVVNATTHQVYFSQHYGGHQNMNANGTPRADSPFAELIGMTPEESAVLRYQVIFFQAETQAYADALNEQTQVDRLQQDLDRKRSMLATALRRQAAARSPKQAGITAARVTSAQAAVTRAERRLRRFVPEADLAAAAGARADYVETLAAPLRTGQAQAVAGFDPVGRIMWSNHARIGANLRASLHYLNACRAVLTRISTANSV
ncbi:hypothetical protein [Rhizobacter sp. SG703]|uniref:hypothetical protein n=1 Tax=Rhizobacter sp. SG703 TaxID=2587140 RepID=UPI001445D3A2|nr:hypothetical protein [Rhizobacter sp. SG703]NKI96101.1 hypothetical protein [Rhizobacter sp. SG703]